MKVTLCGNVYERLVRVGSCLVQCNMERSAIWGLIPITQKADVLVGESFGRTRPEPVIPGFAVKVSDAATPDIPVLQYVLTLSANSCHLLDAENPA